MIQEKVINNLQLLGVGVAKYFGVSMKCPKSRFPISIIVFDELELIIFVSQGLTQSTASLVRTKIHPSWHLNSLSLQINKSIVKSYLKKVHPITQQEEIGIFFGSLYEMFSPLWWGVSHLWASVFPPSQKGRISACPWSRWWTGRGGGSRCGSEWSRSGGEEDTGWWGCTPRGSGLK